ncbi:MAG: bifunctional 4-hydroxy-2-oxoglutarate aldolase/2-dehydro-3-deoxy-phosphogluconate aldolase [Sphingobacteriaceae bacterium]
MKDSIKVLNGILSQGMLPLFYHESAKVSLEVIRALYKAGVRVIEYTNRGEAALQNFTQLKHSLAEELPNLHLGIGTIKTAAEATAFVEAGADFMVSPIVHPQVADIAAKAGILWVPGCMTPTEIALAQAHRAKLIKIFPAAILGPEFISAIRELFPGQLFVPTGGVELHKDNIMAWFKSGVCAVGMGSKLISKSLLEHEQYQELYTQTVAALALIAESRESLNQVV